MNTPSPQPPPDASAPPRGFLPAHRSSPFLDLVGPVWVRRVGGLGTGVYGLRIQERHANSRGSAHGGLLMTFADVVLGYTAAFSQDPPAPLTTASISVDFAGTAKIGDWVEGRADVQRIGRALAFVNAYLSVGDTRIVRASSVLAVAPARAPRDRSAP